MMAFKLVAGSSPVVVVEVVGPHAFETDPGVNLEEDCDRARVVCPIVAFPGNWI